jgi:hypothetical protein
VVAETAPVEDDGLDALLLRLRGQLLADQPGVWPAVSSIIWA